ncbi:MAG: hypothetical protein HFG38_10095 [Eubacterium sp.]|jgi:hypothetical protein|nr:hypothetical protein [Eubacterium sp.]
MDRLYTIEGRRWQTILRVLTLITLFAGAYALVQSVLLLIQDLEIPDLSILVVVIYLLATPFAFLAALMWAYSVHRMAQAGNGDLALVLGFAMMIMVNIDKMVYVSIHREGDSISFVILSGIKLVCFVICFLHYQGIGNRGITLFAAILLVASAALELEEAVRYLIGTGYYALNSYYFIQTLLEGLLASESLLFVFGIKKGYIQKR